MDKKRIEDAVRNIIEAIGEDSMRDGLVDTPKRIANMLSELFSGLEENPNEHVKAVFDSKYENVILLKDIDFVSCCEHHFLPFYGKIHVAYIPKNGKVIGLSKIVRIINCFAKKPQIQESLTNQIAEFLYEKLNAEGVLIVIEAEHMCMKIRGVKNNTAKTITECSLGLYKSNEIMRHEVLKQIHQ